MAFTGQDPARQLHIFIVDVTGGGMKQLTSFRADEGRGQVPAWSADGQRIAFQSSRKGMSHLWVSGIDGVEPRAVTAAVTGVLDEVPAWFPNGRRLAFQSTRSGRMEIWTINADGSGARQITGRPSRTTAAARRPRARTRSLR